MSRVAFNNQINAALCAFFMIVAVVMLVAVVINIRKALASTTPTANEVAPAYQSEPARA